MTKPNELPYRLESYTGYMDYFGDDHKNKEPRVLEDGTSVWFPAGWTDEDADKWRKGHELERPDKYALSFIVFTVGQ